jgi:hypothetical protein
VTFEAKHVHGRMQSYDISRDALMLVLHRVFRCVTPKRSYARRGLATGAGLLGELTSRGFISQVTK